MGLFVFLSIMKCGGLVAVQSACTVFGTEDSRFWLVAQRISVKTRSRRNVANMAAPWGASEEMLAQENVASQGNGVGSGHDSRAEEIGTGPCVTVLKTRCQCQSLPDEPGDR